MSLAQVHRTGPSGRKAIRRRARPAVEELEGRLVPASLGANLDAPSYWSLSEQFVDAIKSADHFTTLDCTAAVPTDAHGWPTTDAEIIVQSGGVGTAHIFNGTYHLSFHGRAVVDTAWTPGGSVSNESYDPTSNTTTADITLNVSESQSWYFVLAFAQTQGGVQAVRLIRPGYDANTTQVFTNAFLNQARLFSTLRFMDWTQTNNNPTANWADRALPTDARQVVKGVAWEYAIALANQLHKDMWVNVPVNASDDYVAQFATLLRNQLNPSLHVYVEYSNEVWNGLFSQYTDNFQAAAAEVQAGNSPLQRSDDADFYTPDLLPLVYAMRRIPERLHQIGAIFTSVYGAGGFGLQYRPVLATQSENGWLYGLQLQFAAQTYGDLSQCLYALAGGGYFATNDATLPANATVNQVLTALSGAVARNISFAYPTFIAAAHSYGLRAVAYEGGDSTMGIADIQTKKQAEFDPRMKDLVVQAVTSFYRAGGDLFNWFNIGAESYDTPYGTYALTDDPTNLNVPKIQGLQAVLQSLGGPAAPAGLTATATSGTAVSLSWTGGDASVSGFLIERQTAGGAFVQVATVAGGVTAYTDTGLTPGTAYAYRVRATDFAGTSGSSATAAVATPAPPAAPTNFAARTTAGQETLTWQDNATNAAGYQVYRRTHGVGTFALVGTLAANATTFADAGLAAGSAYDYQVLAYNSVGSSAAALTATTLPGAVGNVTASAGLSRVVLAWAAVPGATGYTIYRGLRVGGEAATPLAVGVTGTTFTDAGLSNGTVYYYKVVAVDAGGAGSASAEVSARPDGPAAVHVHFTAGAVRAPAGYVNDTGAAYGTRTNGLSYGWNVDNSANAHRVTAGAADELHAGFAAMQKPSNPNASWQIALANGTYRVHLLAGEASAIDSVYRINVNGVLALGGQPTAANHWVEATVTVVVTNGLLIVGNGVGAVNDKLDAIDIVAVPAATSRKM